MRCGPRLGRSAPPRQDGHRARMQAGPGHTPRRGIVGPVIRFCQVRHPAGQRPGCDPAGRRRARSDRLRRRSPGAGSAAAARVERAARVDAVAPRRGIRPGGRSRGVADVGPTGERTPHRDGARRLQVRNIASPRGRASTFDAVLTFVGPASDGVRLPKKAPDRHSGASPMKGVTRSSVDCPRTPVTLPPPEVARCRPASTVPPSIRIPQRSPPTGPRTSSRSSAGPPSTTPRVRAAAPERLAGARTAARRGRDRGTELDWPVVIWIGGVHLAALAAPFYFTWSGLAICLFLYWVTGRARRLPGLPPPADPRQFSDVEADASAVCIPGGHLGRGVGDRLGRQPSQASRLQRSRRRPALAARRRMVGSHALDVSAVQRRRVGRTREAMGARSREGFRRGVPAPHLPPVALSPRGRAARLRLVRPRTASPAFPGSSGGWPCAW